jgi:ABC-type taurine transport system substrate-binding protein
MDLNALLVIERRDLPRDEAWIIRNGDAPELPADLRGKVTVPCIITGSMKLLKDTLTLLRLMNRNRPEFKTAPTTAVKLHLENF